MSAPVPSHLSTVTPRLVVADGMAAIDFYRRAFGAAEHGDRFITPDGVVIHAEVRIGDAIVMIAEEPGDPGSPAGSPVAAAGGGPVVIMATYWPDVDAVWARALEAGAEVIFPLEDQFYGDRAGRIRDPFGHQWILSQRVRDLSPADLVP
ncbi:MAG TPA: VOC family protein [Solirubrobacteraceae bacterium]|nr:VOC family protein [Solirubrobacteraceae bacterium]